MELRWAPAVAGMAAFLEPFRPWLEGLGLGDSEALTLEVDMPFGEAIVEELLGGAPIDRECLQRADPLRPLMERFELPPGADVRILLEPSRDREKPVTAREHAWDPHWKELPVALWLRGLRHPAVAIRIPYVSFRQGPVSDTRSWLLVRREEAGEILARLRAVLGKGRKTLTVIGGPPILLPAGGYDWSTVVLDPTMVRLLRDDFEGFLARESWFRRHRLPFRRGYFLYGPPGNGKTSAIRVMASHPLIEPYTLNFSDRDLDNGTLTYLFESAGRTAPSLVIFEDLDRLYGTGARSADNRTRITLQHLLNCLDGLGSHDGVIVVATANDPTALDPAILRRPGRFDRVLACRPPTDDLRREYLRRLSVDPLSESTLACAAEVSDGFSYAQLREAFILAGHLAYHAGDETIGHESLLEAIEAVRSEGRATTARVETRGVGFDLSARAGA